MHSTLATLSLVASVVGLASCTNSTAAPHVSAHDDQDRTAPPSLAIRAKVTTAKAPASVAEVIAGPKPVAATPSEDDLHRERVVGVWKQYESGVRWLKVRDDGTATMFVDPAGSWAAKAIIGDGLTIQIEWSIEDGRALMKSVSGEPSSTFKAVSTLYGTDRNRAIVQLDDEKFVMLDDSDGSTSEWTRVADASLPRAIAE
jgi:hypothetical protein